MDGMKTMLLAFVTLTLNMAVAFGLDISEEQKVAVLAWANGVAIPFLMLLVRIFTKSKMGLGFSGVQESFGVDIHGGGE